MIDHKACPGEGRTVTHWKIGRNQPIYSSWNGARVIGTLKAGDKVTVLAGVNVILKPDRALVKQPEQPTEGLDLNVGDVVLVYGSHANGDVDFWAKGVWYTEYYEGIGDGGKCGFAGFGLGGCTVDITEHGVKEWWVQLKTKSGRIGWALAYKRSGDKYPSEHNFDGLRTD